MTIPQDSLMTERTGAGDTDHDHAPLDTSRDLRGMTFEEAIEVLVTSDSPRRFRPSD
jgi:hypothetical protein